MPQWSRSSKEITHAENYYNVVAQRTTNRYFLKTSISQECREKKCKNDLQPLLENAVKHGFEGREAPCCLLIRASLETNGELCLLVADNGFGIPPARAKQLNAQLQKTATNWHRPPILTSACSILTNGSSWPIMEKAAWKYPHATAFTPASEFGCHQKKE